MALTTFCKWDDPGAYCPVRYGWGTDEDEAKRRAHPWYVRDTHHGLVLSTYERNGYDDSDFYAIVWDAEAGRPQHIEYATTRGWTYPCSAVVDATPEVQAAYAAWQQATREQLERERAAREAADPTVGKVVQVTGGRGPRGFKGTWVGTVGRIYWRGANQFRTYYRNGYNRPEESFNQRVGLELPDGRRVFTALDNVKVMQEELS